MSQITLSNPSEVRQKLTLQELKLFDYGITWMAAAIKLHKMEKFNSHTTELLRFAARQANCRGNRTRFEEISTELRNYVDKMSEGKSEKSNIYIFYNYITKRLVSRTK